MKKQPEWLMIVFALLLIVFIIANAAILFKRKGSKGKEPSNVTILEDVTPGQMATLKDGSRLELKVVSFGSQYSYSQTPPPDWNKSVPFRKGFKTEGSLEALTLGYYYYPSKAVKFPGEGRPAIREIVLSDETGCTLPVNVDLVRFFDPSLNKQKTYLEEFSSFPRRGNNITAKIYCEDLQHPEAESTFPNPFPASRRVFPVWKPESLPVSHRDKDLTVTAESFTPSSNDELIKYRKVKKSRRRLHITGSQRVYSKILLSVRSNGKPYCNYTVQSATISDPTGNKSDSRYVAHPTSGKPASSDLCIFDSSLGGNEPVVKLKLTCSRQSDGPVPPQDVVRGTNLKLFSLTFNVKTKKTDELPAKHLVIADLPIDVYVLPRGYSRVTSTFSFYAQSECVALILPESATTYEPRIIIRNKKGKILAPDKTYNNQVTVQTYYPKSYAYSSGTTQDEWRTYEDSPKSSTYSLPFAVFMHKDFPYVLLYGLPKITSDDVLSISIDVNPVHTFEFTLPMPSEIMNHSH